jgi:hypothetical protein
MKKSTARMLVVIGAAAALSCCGKNGRLFPDIQARDVLGVQYEKSAPAIRQPVLPEMLVACRGHVLVPALGMLLIPKGKEPPQTGQYLREERLSAPYRILPPGARVSQEMSPTRLNVELDAQGRIIGLYCG